MLVVFLFLRRMARATIAAGVTVPLSLAGTCARDVGRADFRSIIYR